MAKRQIGSCRIWGNDGNVIRELGCVTGKITHHGQNREKYQEPEKYATLPHQAGWVTIG